MKRIRQLSNPTPGLAAYIARAARTGRQVSWHRFARNSARKLELANALIDIQRGLCGYCEKKIALKRQQIEHIVPQSHPIQGKTNSLKVGNMMACCLGGTLATASDRVEYMDPVKDNMSCGQKKSNKTIQNLVDPRKLPPLPSLITVESNGHIQADKAACSSAGWAISDVNRTIEFLGLNVERLRVARAEHWRSLDDVWKKHYDDANMMRAAAQEHLLPSNGNLDQFFTTSRSFFAEWGGEDILAEDPQRWI